jgi:hypothetical protein
MADQVTQTYSTHRKYVPAFHFLTLGILVINLGWSVYRLFRPVAPVFDSVLALLVAFALILIALYARTFALTAQDRVIRLEERQRLAELLPADLRPRIGDLTRGQLIALRFAGDGEVAELTRKVLAGNITNRDEIKKLIKDWRPDDFRA